MNEDREKKVEIRKTPEFRSKKFLYKKSKAVKNKKQKGDYKPYEEDSTEDEQESNGE
ncbi:hypothetical protein M9Y10_002545 [Tritrichomonas musculus]|uniref:Uncharacterized protein n=1 Tax=Tritrichomonas musculus TaxID=1915356 RepID=A0ABR2LAG1_9EUKA